MTTPLGVWQITDEGPTRLGATNVDLERQLEDWLERDPSLLQHGLTIVGRQMVIEGGRLDLLALDPQGRLTVIEIKAGAVRRDTVAQALDYASCLAVMPERDLAARIDSYLARHSPGEQCSTYAALMEERAGLVVDLDATAEPGELREIAIQVVGTGRDQGLERMINYLAGAGEIDVSVVSFEVFQTASGERVLIRELTEADSEVVERREQVGRPCVTVEDVLARADKAGIGESFRLVLEAATEVGLHSRPYKNSIMFTPPSNKTRCIIYLRALPYADGRLYVYVAAEAMEEFFRLPVARTQRLLADIGGVVHDPRDQNGLRFDHDAVPRVAEAIRGIFARPDEVLHSR